MVVPNDSAPPMSGGKAPASPDDFSDLEYVTDSQDETPPELAIKGSATRLSGQNSSGNRYGSGGDREMGQRLPQDGAPASNVLPPRMSKQGHESLYQNAASEANRRTGDNREYARNDAREVNEQYTGEKRPYHASDSHRRDSRDERGHSYAKTGGETEVQRPHRPLEDARRSHDVREDKGFERRDDRERRGGGAENRQHRSSATRSYSAIVVNETDPRYMPQRERRSSPNDAMPGGPPQGQGPPPQQRQSTSQPHSHPEGHSNQNDRSGNMGRQDRRELDSTAVRTPPYPPPPGPDTSEGPEGERQQALQENHQGTSGKGFLGKIGTFLGAGLPMPSECKCKEHEEHIVKMEAKMRHQHQENQRLIHQRDQLGQRLDSADREVFNLTEKLRFAQTELNNVHKELVDAKALSDTRGKELIGAQTFLTKADTISVSEIVGLARTVNNEILQMAASLCDAFSPEAYMETEEESQQNHASVEKAIGPELTKLMENIPDRSAVNPLVVQIVLQSLLCSHLGREIERWLDHTSTEKIFVALYDNIRRTENQAVSGRWRALTRAGLRPQLDRWVKNFLNQFVTITHLAGWRLADPELGPTLGERLQPIFKAAEKLRRAMGEQFTSADIEIAIPEPYMPFNDRELEDDWGDARNPNSSAQDIVGGTTGIGLKRRVAHDGSDEIISYEIILPPKVVLLSSLKEIAEPPPPRQKRKKVTSGDGPGASG